MTETSLVRFYHELKRRKVIRLAIVYLVAGMVILEGADVLVPALALPEWVLRLVALLLILGFPLALIMAWQFDWTPAGITRTGSVDETAPAVAPTTAEPPAVKAANTDEPTAPAKASVAVLPFVNMSGDKENEYFSDGLSEELLNVLSRIDSLKVAARTSSFEFKGQTGDIAEIARKLNVASILEGSVRQSGRQVRITAQLINATDGYHLWSDTFDRELDDIFAVQDEIASSVAEALKVRLLGEDRVHLNAGGTANAEAFQAYLQGVHFRNLGTDEPALRNAVEAFQRAIDLDPEYAQAYAGMAKAWEELAASDFVGLDQVASKVGEAATKAIELAPDLADGYQVLGRMLFMYKLDLDGGRKALETALALNPGNAESQIEYSQIQSVFGEHALAVKAAKTALELDPVSPHTNHYMGHALYLAGRYDEAIPVYRHVLDMNRHHPRPHFEIGMCQHLQGNSESALKEVEQEPLGWMRHTGTAITLQQLGQIEKAETALALLIENYGDNGVYQHADVYAQWGDADQAIQALNRAYEIGDPGITQLLVDPLLEPIRDDPRFVELLQKIGFAAI